MTELEMKNLIYDQMRLESIINLIGILPDTAENRLKCKQIEKQLQEVNRRIND